MDRPGGSWLNLLLFSSLCKASKDRFDSISELLSSKMMAGTTTVILKSRLTFFRAKIYCDKVLWALNVWKLEPYLVFFMIYCSINSTKSFLTLIRDSNWLSCKKSAIHIFTHNSHHMYRSIISINM